MHIVMPWFLPAAALVAWWGARTAREVKRRGDFILLLGICGAPLLLWILAQFTFIGRQP